MQSVAIEAFQARHPLTSQASSANIVPPSSGHSSCRTIKCPQNYRHLKVGPQLGSIAERFQSRLCCHARVEPYLSAGTRADVRFNAPPREVHAGDIEVIHTPGHTDNNVCYRYASHRGRTYLFTGDTLYLHGGQWRTLVVGSDGGDRRDLARSLERLRGLRVDVIVCSVAVGPMRIVEVTPGEWRRLIDGLLGPLRRG